MAETSAASAMRSLPRLRHLRRAHEKKPGQCPGSSCSESAYCTLFSTSSNTRPELPGIFGGLPAVP